MNNEIVVGQKLWFVSSQNRPANRFVTVTKVGRKWITVHTGMRIDKETLVADGGNYMSPGKCYVSKEDYEAREALRNAWDMLRREVYQTYNVPPGMTIETIQATLELLLGKKGEVDDPDKTPS